MRCASSAGIISPVKHSSCATPLPHNRASRCDPPYPGKIPSFTSGCPSFAVLLAIRMVQESASSQPPPSANPLIAQIDGFPIVSSRWKTPWPKSENSLPLTDRKSTRLNSSHGYISYAVFCLKKKNHKQSPHVRRHGARHHSVRRVGHQRVSCTSTVPVYFTKLPHADNVMCPYIWAELEVLLE